MIIGCSGAGKSTLSKELAKLTLLKLIHLDKLFWKQGWEKTDAKDWQEIVKQETEKDSWILDGNYNSSLDLRFQRADTIIFFDFPRWLCLYNIYKRILKYKFWGHVRNDIPKDCPERMNLEFFLWVWNYNKVHRDRYLTMMTEQTALGKKTIILKNYHEKREFLRSLTKNLC